MACIHQASAIMSAFESLLKICLPSDESLGRRSSGSSTNSKSSKSSKSSLLTSIEESFDSMMARIRELPAAIETKLEDFAQSVTELPSQIEDSFDVIVTSLNEYIPHHKLVAKLG